MSEDELIRTDVGASVEVTLTRGTGTRDQEKFRIKGKGRTAEDALKEFDEQLLAIEEYYAERVRGIQPVEDDE